MKTWLFLTGGSLALIVSLYFLVIWVRILVNRAKWRKFRREEHTEEEKFKMKKALGYITWRGRKKKKEVEKNGKFYFRWDYLDDDLWDKG